MNRFKKFLEIETIAVDTETYGDIKKVSVFHPTIQAAYIGFCTKKRPYSYPVGSINPTFIKKLASPNVVKVFWNAAFDVPVIKKLGLEINGPIVDAMILAQLIHRYEQSYSLKFFAGKYLNDRYDEEVILKRYIAKHNCSYGDVPYEIIGPYLDKDTTNTYLLYSLIMNNAKDDMFETFMLENNLLPIVLDMMSHGIKIHKPTVFKHIKKIKDKLVELKEEIVNELGDININSPKQLVEALWPDGNPSHGRFTGTGAVSSDNTSMLLDGRPVCLKINEYREASKGLNTYYMLMLEESINGRLHPSFHQTRAITGRFACSDPNLQNQPRANEGILGEIRNCYVADSNNHSLVCIDYDQIEIRLTAHFSGEQHLIDSILQGKDNHGEVCKLMFKINESDPKWKEMRVIAKTLNFSILYGSGAEGVADSLLTNTKGKFRITTSEARDYIIKWWEQHPKISQLADKLESEVALTGGVRTFGGRFIPVANNKDHAVLNYLIQGSAADLIKQRMLEIGTYLGKRYNSDQAKMILTVHDELIFCIRDDLLDKIIPKLVKIMEEPSLFKVPITCSVEVGKRWGKKKPWKKKISQ